jgi:hypothetical protein
MPTGVNNPAFCFQKKKNNPALGCSIRFSHSGWRVRLLAVGQIQGIKGFKS